MPDLLNRLTAIKRRIAANRAVRESVLLNRAYFLYASLRATLHWRFERVLPDDLAGLKRSDTLVILGSGESINELSEAQWRELSQFDVLGFSYSCLLPIEHMVYFFEVFDTDISIRHHIDKFLPIIRQRQREGRLGRVIWKNPESRALARQCQVEDFERMFSVNLLGATDRVVSAMAESVLRYRIYRKALVQYRGSVVAFVLLAALFGYRRVIFAGIDLRGARYFFETDPQYEHHGLINPLLLEDPLRRMSTVHHASNDPARGVPIADTLKVLTRTFSHMTWHVTSPNSALAEFLPIWEWSPRHEHA